MPTTTRISQLVIARVKLLRSAESMCTVASADPTKHEEISVDPLRFVRSAMAWE